MRTKAVNLEDICLTMAFSLKILFSTRSLPAYEYIILGKIWLSYQLYSSSADCGRELFKPSKDVTRLGVCNEKIFLALDFCE